MPETLGVNIHFTEPQPGEVEMLAAAGFRWVRMDFVWQSTEIEKGKYDFSAYDRLLDALDKHQIRALFILDYSNTLYDNGHAPYTDEGRRAFASWATAAVSRYRGRGILWEIYNEPNTGFWTPKPNISEYVKLALETSKAIHDVAPGEQIIGPAVWGMDFEFVEECLRSGLLNYWSAVSVHPYRKPEPETVVDDYARLRKLIDKYAPAGKRVPIISSEWGYSAASFNVGEEKQATLLARQLLINQSQGVKLSIWYDWQDDGRNPREIEHHFGTVLPLYYSGREPVYDAKPAYRAMQTLSRFLAGYRFSQRVSLTSDDYVLAFQNKGDIRLAAWTTAWFNHTVTLPVSPGNYRILDHTGETSSLKTATESGLVLNLTNTPQYVVLEKP
jgi:polysaccharide biosynthesis protein PslG